MKSKYTNIDGGAPLPTPTHRTPTPPTPAEYADDVYRVIQNLDQFAFSIHHGFIGFPRVILV